MTLGQGKLFGISIKRDMGSDRKWYLTAVIWIPRDWSRKHLRYFSPSMRWF